MKNLTKVVVLENGERCAVLEELNIEEKRFLVLIKLSGDDDFVLVEKVGKELLEVVDPELKTKILILTIKKLQNKFTKQTTPNSN